MSSKCMCVFLIFSGFVELKFVSIFSVVLLTCLIILYKYYTITINLYQNQAWELTGVFRMCFQHIKCKMYISVKSTFKKKGWCQI